MTMLRPLLSSLPKWEMLAAAILILLILWGRL